MKKNILFFFLFVILLSSCFSSKINQKKIASFTSSEKLMIHSGIETEAMRLFIIYNEQDSILLRKRSLEVIVDSSDISLQLLIDRMYATVTDEKSMGAGIAAPQVGILKRIIWVQRFDKEDFPFEVYLNPTIVEYSEDKIEFMEGCLSIPGRREKLNTRSQEINIQYDTWNGERISETIEGFTSVIFQHEVDHLDGILYLDHLNKERRKSKNGE